MLSRESLLGNKRVTVVFASEYHWGHSLSGNKNRTEISDRRFYQRQSGRPAAIIGENRRSVVLVRDGAVVSAVVAVGVVVGIVVSVVGDVDVVSVVGVPLRPVVVAGEEGVKHTDHSFG